MTAAIAAARRIADRPLGAGGALRRAAGLAVLALGAAALAERAWTLVSASPAAAAALEATAITAAATAVGALPVLALARIGATAQQAMLGFGGGVMVAAALVTLLVPAFDAASGLAGHPAWAAMLVASGLVAGGLALAAMDRALPHQHLGGAERKRVALVALAIALHNLPEGLAVGVAAAADGSAAVTLGIALQNVPEGLVVAAALASLGIARGTAVAAAIATGLVEPVGGVAGAVLADASAAALPWALAFAAGAMLFVVAHEIVPALRRDDGAVRGALAASAGVVAMTALGAAVG
jgi:ZIP family zinc transporter